MPGATEIYICWPGQAIKDGKVEYGSIATRGEAEADAARRVRIDSTIAKIAYYAVKEDGGFRTLYSFDNPHAAKTPERRSAMDDLNAPSLGVRQRTSLFKRIRAVFEED
jgi:hypothetical protein